jgi:parvulin-like peptidyl-prolyl isomerase
MGFELDDIPEPKDRTKLIWGVVLGIVAVMLVTIWWAGRLNPNRSVVRVKHVLIMSSADPAEQARARELIRELRERIVNGEDFGKIAEQYSNDPGSARRGGDLGYIGKGEMVKEMEEYAWQGPLGELSPVLQSSLGYHIAIVTDRHLSKVDQLKIMEEREVNERSANEGDTGTAEPSS